MFGGSISALALFEYSGQAIPTAAVAKREALLLLGGDKGDDWRFYERAIPRAEQLWEAHLAELEREGDR